MSSYERLALGAPGAGAVRPEWFTALSGAKAIVTWGGGNKAGEHFNALVAQNVEQCLGRAWVVRHPVRAAPVPAGIDVGDLHLTGRLDGLLRGAVAP
jgi:hypothetical protein